MAKFEKFDSRKHITGLSAAARQIQIEELVRKGQVPLLDQVAAAIEEARPEYRPRTAAARQKRDSGKANYCAEEPLSACKLTFSREMGIIKTSPHRKNGPN